MRLLCRCLFLGFSLAEQSVVISTIHQVISTTTCWIFASKRNNLSIDTMSSRTGELPGVLPKAMTPVSHFKKKSVFTNGFFMNDSLRAVFWTFKWLLLKWNLKKEKPFYVLFKWYHCPVVLMYLHSHVNLVNDLLAFQNQHEVGTVDLSSF